MFPTLRAAQIEQVVAEWAARGPSFLWAPTSQDTWLLDRAKGLTARVSGSGGAIAFGGIPNVAPNSSDSYIEFPTNAGLEGVNPTFIGVMLVSIDNASSLTGCMLKIGDSATGIGFGVGDTTAEDSGTKPVMLREGIAWYPGSTTGFLSSGLNVLSFGYTNQAVLAMRNEATNVEVGASGGSSIAATSNLYINGYTTSRGSNVKVHAVAIYPKSLANVEFVAERELLTNVAARILFRGPSRNAGDALFVPRRRWTPVSAAAGAAPTLLTASAINIASASARARVTFTR